MKTIDLESKPLDQSPPNKIPSQISKPHSDQTLQTSLIANDANNETGRPFGLDLKNFIKFSSYQNVDWEPRPKFIRRFSSNSSSIKSTTTRTTTSSLLLFSSKVFGHAMSHFNLKNPELLIEEVSELEDLETDELIGRMFEQIHQQNHQPENPNAISSTSEKVDITNRSYYSIDYLYSLLEKTFETHCTSSSFSQAPVSISCLKTNLERFYILAPQEIFQNL
ncbi:hypothetical protein BY996DRAFT_8482083 [Phakopsora pachyrhizi]|nr:hypothetical protein BY996DRAFT_8482083 [Phakopsora pachyrhizi]